MHGQERALVGLSSAMAAVRHYVQKVAQSDAGVLIRRTFPPSSARQAVLQVKT
jgi:hypothetical protein